MLKRIAITAAVVLLSAPAVANAARPVLSLHQADAATERAINTNTQTWNEEQALAAAEPEEGIAPQPTILSTEFDGCDMLGRYRAECPFVTHASDASDEETVLDVTIGLRGHVHVYWPEDA